MKKVKVYIYIVFALFILPKVSAQTIGNILQINSTTPSGLNVCFNEDTIKVLLENPSPFTLKNVNLAVTMPAGLDYEIGSVTGANEVITSPQNTPVFSLDSIIPGYDTLTLIIKPSCNIVPFLDLGGIPRIRVRVDYTANSFNYYDTAISNPFIISSPNLSITQVTNQTYSGNVGDTYQRCITIINGGSGALSSFTLTNTHGTGIDITNVSNGSWTSVGNKETVILSGANFTSIGDGDTLFENGETIIICEDVEITNCSDVYTNYLAYWGCGSDTCQQTIETANAFFPFTTPNITVSSVNNFSNCFDSPKKQELIITNSGPGKAVNISTTIYNSTNGSFNGGVLSDIDATSIFYIDGIGDTIIPLLDSIYPKSNSCSSNASGGFILNIAEINSGDTIRIKWDVTTCCSMSCSDKYFQGWFHKVTYRDLCGQNYNNGQKRGGNFGYTEVNILNNGNPASLFNGSSGTYSFFIDKLNITRLDEDTNGQFKIVITKNSCMNFTGGFGIKNSSNTITWLPDSTLDNGDSLIAYFKGPKPGNFNGGTIVFDYLVSCSGCSGGTISLGLDIYYTPNINCGCELKLDCFVSQPITIVCPASGCNGFAISQYTFERLNFDPPDYNEDGIPDAPIAAHKDSVEKYKSIYGDTIISQVSGKILSDSNWLFLFGNSHLTNRDYLSFISLNLTITDSNGNNYTYNNYPVTVNNLPSSEKEINFNLSVDSLSARGALPSSFVFKKNDSLTLTIKYFVENNESGAIINVANTFRLFLSDTSSPVREDQKFDCVKPIGNIQNVNYFTDISTGNVTYTLGPCDQAKLTKQYYFSVGPCCSNFAGGNLFKKEYRSLSRLKIIGLKLPNGYNIIQTRIRERRTVGSGSLWSSWVNIFPRNISNDSVFYEVDTSLYNAYGGPALFSDEGFQGTLEVYVEPTCNIIPDSIFAVPYWTEQTLTFNSITKTGYRNDVANTNIQYNPPKIQVQSLNPSLVTTKKTVTWTVVIDNLSNVTEAPNLWFNKGNTSGVNTVSIFDVKNGIYLPSNANGFYFGDTIAPQENRQFLVTATFTNCTIDSINLQVGWKCGTHPDSVQDIDCAPETIYLKVTPLPAVLETNIISQPDTIGLCDTLNILVEGENIQRGFAYELKFFASIPTGMTIVPGSSYVSLFDTNSFVPISDPTNVFAFDWKWDIDSNIIYLDTNGLEGILNTSINKVYIKFKVVTDCQFSSGDIFTVDYRGVNPCGTSTNIAKVGSKPIYIIDALPAYSSTVKINTDYLRPCTGNTYVEVTVINNGPTNTFSQDSVFIQLPANIDYVAGSFVGVYNPPGATSTSTTNVLYKYIKWPLTSGISVGDSSVFGFEINANPDSVDCNVFQMRAACESSGGSFCSSTSSFCNINIIVDDTLKNIFIYKGYLSILNDSCYSEFAPPTGETGYFNFDIQNTGETIATGQKVIVSYYFDADNNGVYSTADVWFGNDTIKDSIPSFSTIPFKDTVAIPAGNSCSIIAVIDTSENPCTCSPSQISFTLPINDSLNDTVVCANTSFSIGVDSVDGYNYTWSPSQYLNDSSLSNPTFSYPPSNLNDTLIYYLEINRINCLFYDTLTIIINGEPISNAGPDQNICDVTSATLAGNQPIQNWKGEWNIISSPNTPIFTDSTLYNTTINNLIEGQYVLTWTVSNDSCDPAIDTVTLNIYDLPIANAGPDRFLCDSNSIRLNANNPIGLSKGKWVVLAGPNAPTLSNDSLYNSQLSGLIEGVYRLEWTVSNGNCPPDKDTLDIEIYDKPIAIAGSDQDLCNLFNTTLNATPVSGSASGIWAFISGPNTPSISNNSIHNPSLTGLIEGNYLFTWTVSNGVCPPETDSLYINVYNQPVASAGVDQNLCNQNFVILGANNPTGTATGLWTFISGPNTPSIVDSSQYNTAVTNLIEGTYLFSWTVTNGTCDTMIDSVIISTYNSPTANAGANQTLCNQYSTVVIANTPMGTANGLWKFDSTSNIIIPTIVNPFNEVTSIINLQEGTFRFIWTVSNGNCPPAIDTIEITVFDSPIANAGIDQDLCNQYNTTLSGNIPSGTASGEWFLLNGPNIPNINDSSLYNTSITGMIEGSYTLIWVVSNGNCSPSTDTVVINVYDSPTALVGPNQSLCDQYTTTLSGNNPISGTGTWSILSAPNTPTISNLNQYNATISSLINGQYILIWTVSNGNCPPASDTLRINVYESPIINAGVNQSFCNTSFISLNGSIPPSGASGTWTILNAPNIPNIVSPNSPNTSVNGLIQGIYDFVWTITNGVCPPVSDTVTVYNYAIPNVEFEVDTNAICQNQCVQFSTNSSIAAPSSITDYHWVLSNGVISNDSTPLICFNQSGDFDVKLIVTSNNGCKDSLSIADYITVYPLPKAYFDVEPEYHVLTYDHIQIKDGSSNADYYTYYFGNGDSSNLANPSHLYEDSGKYIITQIVENLQGCKDTFERPVFVCQDLVLYIPNAFTPNGDEHNEVFIPSLKGAEYLNYNFSIFNRWGELIFETQLQDVGWDGYFKGTLSQTDVYVWKITVENGCTGKTISKIGHVSLLR